MLCDDTSDNRLVAVFGLFGHFSEGVGTGKESHEKVVDIGEEINFDMGLGTNFLQASNSTNVLCNLSCPWI